jgi:hypothetical protein
MFAYFRERPYQHDSTASRPLSEVKHVRAWLVLRWGTTLESQVLFSFCLSLEPLISFSFSFSVPAGSRTGVSHEPERIRLSDEGEWTTVVSKRVKRSKK